MKSIIITILAFALVPLAVQAQKSPTVMTVNMEELYENYSKAQDASEKFKSSVQSAEDEVRTMIEEGRELFKELQELEEKINNPGTAEEAKEGLIAELEEKQNVVRKKEAEVNQYREKTQRTLQQRRQSIVKLHLDEIKKVVSQVAQENGADMVLNSNPNSAAVIYFDDSFDMTEEVLTKLNVDIESE